MDYHLVIHEFVLLGKHHKPVKSEKTSEFGAFKNVYPLIFALLRMKMLINSDGHFSVL